MALTILNFMAGLLIRLKCQFQIWRNRHRSSVYSKNFNTELTSMELEHNSFSTESDVTHVHSIRVLFTNFSQEDIWSSLKRFIKERKRFLSAVSIAPFLTWSDVSLTQNTSSLHVTNTFPAEGPFQSDALLVPEHCLFDHIHNQTKCWNFDQWNGTAGRACSDRSMRLRSFAMLLPCGIDVFSGVEFVCCPTKKARKGQQEEGRDPNWCFI